MLKRLVLVAVVAVACLLFYLNAKNPETSELTDDVRAAAGGRYVRLTDGVTHYDVAGPEDGQRVVLVHGFSVPLYIWDSTSVALSAAGFRVARFDAFGRGYSDRPDTDYTLDLEVRQIGELLDSLGWKGPVDLIGLSAGGPVVAAFAGRMPDRVRSVVFVDPAAGKSGGLPFMFRMPVLGGLFWQAVAVPKMPAGQVTDFVDPSGWPDWTDRYRVQMQYRGFGRALRRSLLAGASVDLDTLYARVGAAGTRALLIWGTEDSTVAITNAEQLTKAIPSIEFHPIDRAGHLPHMERTDVVNPLLVHFLRPEADSTAGAAPPG